MCRMALRALACITLGALTTAGSIVVMAAVPLRAPLKLQEPSSCYIRWRSREMVGVCSARAYEAPAYQAYLFAAPTLRTDDYRDFNARGMVPVESFLPSAALPYADEFLRAGEPMMNFRERVIEVYGWPWPADYSVTDALHGPRGRVLSVVTGWPVAEWSHARQFWPDPFPAVIPVRPIWAGLVADTAVFACTWAMVPALFWLAGAARRRRRAARGFCPFCGYDRKGAPSDACPECGRAAPRSRRLP
jgi:hypothetical protein